MRKVYFDNPTCNVAFERCIDVLAELIEKYAGKFTMSDIGYDYCIFIGNTPVTVVVTSYENSRNWFGDYYDHSYRKRDSEELKSKNELCQKAS